MIRAQKKPWRRREEVEKKKKASGERVRFSSFFSSFLFPSHLENRGMSSYFAAATAAIWGSTSAETDKTSAHINPKHATKEEVDSRIDALAAALASTDTAALLRRGGEPGLLPTPTSCTIDRATLSRWLKAEKLDVASAASRLEKHAHWRADYVSCWWNGEGGMGEEREGSEEREMVILASNVVTVKNFLTLDAHLLPPFSHSIFQSRYRRDASSR